jgi:hypothetical protein
MPVASIIPNLCQRFSMAQQLLRWSDDTDKVGGTGHRATPHIYVPESGQSKQKTLVD